MHSLFHAVFYTVTSDYVQEYTEITKQDILLIPEIILFKL
jgi:hypothetical protein